MLSANNSLYDDIDLNNSSPWATNRPRILAPSVVRLKEAFNSRQSRLPPKNLILKSGKVTESSSLNNCDNLKSDAANDNKVTSANDDKDVEKSSTDDSKRDDGINTFEVGKIASLNSGNINSMITNLSLLKNKLINNINSSGVPNSGTWGTGSSGKNAGLSSLSSSVGASGIHSLSAPKRRDLYNPAKPNDFEQIVRERKKAKQIEEMIKLREEENEKMKRERERQSIASKNNFDDYSRRSHRSSSSENYRSESNFQNEVPEVDSKKTFAARMMEKMGWKEGEGLGREKQGIVAPLVAKKTDKRSGVIVQGSKFVSSGLSGNGSGNVTENSNPPADYNFYNSQNLFVNYQGVRQSLAGSIQGLGVSNTVDNSIGQQIGGINYESRIILLRNMVGRGEIDEDLKEETEEEAGKYGNLLSVRIIEVPGATDDESVRLFLEYETIFEAKKALQAMNGRKFGGRVVKANFYDENKFLNNVFLAQLR